jgi:hypothetical protein
MAEGVRVSHPTFQALRRRLALAGGHVATTAAPGVLGRSDSPTHAPARLLEAPLRAFPIGPGAALAEPVAFLDGVQETTVLGHIGTHPIVAARIGAGVRRRVSRRTRGVVARETMVIVGRPEALARFVADAPAVQLLAISDGEPAHPIGDIDRARAVVDRARIQLELEVATDFRARHRHELLVVDGTITASPEWAIDPQMVGVIKSHAALPFDGAALEGYLTLPPGHRSSVFLPATRQLTPVHSWGLRLRPWQGHDLMHGLVRIEVAESDDPTGRADAVSRWLLAEVAPLAADPRADRLLYGVHDVERWLRARSA